MKFLLRKKFSGKNLFGIPVEIEANTYHESDNTYILYNKLPLCNIRSDTAKQMFIWADDGNEYERYACENIILFSFREREWTIQIPKYDGNNEIIGYDEIVVTGRFTPDEVSYIKKTFPHLVLDGPTLIFNDFFYVGSDIKDLQKLATYLNR